MHTKHNKKALRFGIMCSGTIFPKWQANCLKKLLELEHVEPALLIVDESAASENLLGKPNKLRPSSILFQLYSRVIIRTDFRKAVDMSGFLSDVPAIRCNVIKRGKFSEYFKGEDIRRIKEFNLDFILKFGFNIIRGEILTTAHYGVWSFCHSDEIKYRDTPPCFWEIFNDDPVTGAVLERLTDHPDEGVVLKKGFFPTISYSYTANLGRVLFESSIWPVQVCTDIFNGNHDYIYDHSYSKKSSLCGMPKNTEVILFLFKLKINLLKKIFLCLFQFQDWNIGVVNESIDYLLDLDKEPVIHWLPRPEKGHFRADPFGITRDDVTYIIYEDFSYSANKGVIKSIELTNTGSIIVQRDEMCASTHFSYPYFFEHKGTFYCIPETAEIREVLLYKAEHSLNHWLQVATLLKDFPGIDSTIFEYGGRWWLMCGNAADGKDYKLFVWHATSLFGPWHPHALNPVKIDVRSARPAGTPFVHDGYLFRPAQDCTRTYGRRVVLNRVTQLTTTAFAEESIRIIEPDIQSYYRDGLHTISAAGNITLIDGKRHKLSLRGFSHAIVRGFSYVTK